MANYHVHVNDQSTGPFTEEQLREQLAAGTINDDTLVWAEGSPDWVAFKELKLDKPKIQLRQKEPAAMQFERAEFGQSAAAAVTCVGCKSPIPDMYYVVDGKIACARCSAGVQASQTGGSGMMRFLRALGAGLAAAIVSATVWWAVLKFLNMQLGLLAIGVGLLVGFAVRWGSQGRGGWKYQLLAILLTYAAIVSSYIPLIVEGMNKNQHEQTEPGATETETSAGMKIVAYTVMFVVALAMPFLMGVSNLIGLLIIGIALYEAWKINKRTAVDIDGPFQVGAPRPAT